MSSPTEVLKAAVMAAEGARAAAFVARDAAALEQLLDERLVYVHATGVKHDRPQLLQFVREGPRFLAVHQQAPHVELLADEVALVTGLLHIRLQRKGEQEPVELASWASAVWMRTDGAWRLVSFQSTKT
jgi:ketosteroid isomerase-like protein